MGEVGKQSIVWFLTFSATLLSKIIAIGSCMSRLYVASQRWDVFWDTVYITAVYTSSFCHLSVFIHYVYICPPFFFCCFFLCTSAFLANKRIHYSFWFKHQSANVLLLIFGFVASYQYTARYGWRLANNREKFRENILSNCKKWQLSSWGFSRCLHFVVSQTKCNKKYHIL